MLQTFDFTSIREVKTEHRRRMPFSPSRKFETARESLLDERPNTTMLHRNMNQPNYKTVQFAEQSLRSTFRNDMNEYVDRKIKQLTHKRQIQKDVYRLQQQGNESTLNPQFISREGSSQNSPRNVFQMRISSKLRRSYIHREKLLAQPYLVNSKEKISRLISLKKEAQDRYSQLTNAIEHKYNQKELRKKNIIRYNFKQQMNDKRADAQPWDKDWVQQAKAQITRYRKRLVDKHHLRAHSVSLNLTIQ